jgi:NAD(P)H-hydrate repair Nnr-like enzyme with NAD(P)H-hydrate dehydratase domain
MASLLGVDKVRVQQDAGALVRRAARRLGVTIALKGAETWISSRGDAPMRFRGGVVGLGTSGSGDTLAGIITGLAARGASPATATAWGVWAHGMAGQALTKRVGRVGFLAREVLAELPALVGR